MALLTTSGNRRKRGATLLALLVVIAVIGVAAALAAQSWTTRIRRDKEQELLFRGLAYKHALESYARLTPPGAGVRPDRIEDLLEDPRSPVRVRHLRSLYADPMTGRPFVLVRESSGAIRGVASADSRAPLMRTGFPDELASFAIAKRYSEWRFLAEP